MDYKPYRDLDDNEQQRTCCLLVLDASESMNQTVSASGKRRIDELNDGLALLQRHLREDEIVSQRVRVSVIKVGGSESTASVCSDWVDAAHFTSPKLTAAGATPLGAGLILALTHLEGEKDRFKERGIPHTRPWIMVITDGEPTDSDELWERATRQCKRAEKGKHCVIYPIGVGDANMASLQQISTTPALRMADAKVDSFFVWLGNSLEAVSNSKDGEAVQLSPHSPWSVVGGY